MAIGKNRTKLVQLFLLATLLAAAAHISAQKPDFPLNRQPGTRYLTTPDKRPYLINAVTAWMIYQNCTLDDARKYLLQRKDQGFNTILTMTAYNPQTDSNRNGQRPFGGHSDFSLINDGYFDFIHRVISIADSLHMFVVLTTPWQGCCQWGYGLAADNAFQRNGPAKCYRLGQYLGKKFKNLTNIMWMLGGDQDPRGDRQSIESMAKGLYETSPRQLQTYHAKPTHSSTDLYQFAPWLGVSSIYTYWRDKPDVPEYPQMLEVYEMALREYMKTDTIPFFLAESQYEGFDGNAAGTALMARRQSYWTILCGGMGSTYGDDSWDVSANWAQIIKSSPGGWQMKHCYDFFSSVEWWRLVPDYKHLVVQKGYGDMGRPNYVSAALSNDSSFFAAYIPVQQTITVDLSTLSKKQALVQWFDPRTGEYTLIGHFKNVTRIYFTPPSTEDWLLYAKVE